MCVFYFFAKIVNLNIQLNVWKQFRVFWAPSTEHLWIYVMYLTTENIILFAFHLTFSAQKAKNEFPPNEFRCENSPSAVSSVCQPRFALIWLLSVQCTHTKMGQNEKLWFCFVFFLAMLNTTSKSDSKSVNSRLTRLSPALSLSLSPFW